MATTFESVKEQLEYYLGRKVTEAEVDEALEWLDYSQGDLAEYVDAMKQIGAL